MDGPKQNFQTPEQPVINDQQNTPPNFKNKFFNFLYFYTFITINYGIFYTQKLKLFMKLTYKLNVLNSQKYFLIQCRYNI